MSSQAAVRAKRKAERVMLNGSLFHPDAPHGTTSGYNSYGCRCEPCFTVESRRREKRRTTYGAGDWTPMDSLAVDAWARSHQNRTPLQPDPHLYALLHEEEMAA